MSDKGGYVMDLDGLLCFDVQNLDIEEDNFLLRCFHDFMELNCWNQLNYLEFADKVAMVGQ